MKKAQGFNPLSFAQNPHDPESEPALAVETSRLRLALSQQEPDQLAVRAGAAYIPGNRQALHLDLFGSPVELNFPELVACREPNVPLQLPLQALLIYYLSTTDGSAPMGEWVSFAELPGGRVYAQAFQGYSGSRLVRAFGENVPAFKQACQSAGGAPVSLGDAAYRFTALPRVPLLVAYWQGEDEIPSACKILFDRTATRHLPIDVCAILGSMLVSRILKSAPNLLH